MNVAFSVLIGSVGEVSFFSSHCGGRGGGGRAPT